MANKPRDPLSWCQIASEDHACLHGFVDSEHGTPIVILQGMTLQTDYLSRPPLNSYYDRFGRTRLSSTTI